MEHIVKKRSIAGFMTNAASRFSRMRRSGSASRLVVAIAVLAFALQSYFTQTHIHILSQGLGLAHIAATQKPEQSKIPLNSSPVDCPFCQAVTHAGVFFAPAALLFYVSAVWLKSIAFFLKTREPFNASAYDWQSRGPPRL
jgi:hypothetical protein